MFDLDPRLDTPLVAQIVDALRKAIVEGRLRAGSKLPSIRQFAHAHNVSTFTVVDAYDRLVAQGYLQSRPHSGFFVRSRPQPIQASIRHGPNFDFDAMWYLRRIFENRSLQHKPGCGWLPGDWLFQDGVERAMRGLARNAPEISGYGEPKGYAPLRALVQELLTEQQISAGTDQILLTQGSSQAMDLAARRLVRPGDAVLVDDPGYPNQQFSLRFMGARLFGVPRTPAGYDLESLERLAQEHGPKVFFTQPRLQSPTGSVASLAQLHRVMQLAERYDFLVVENDIYADLDPEPRPSLASLDQLRRVVYISSFSKTISPNIRVGYLVADGVLADDLAQLKMLSGLTSSEFGERMALGALTDGRWRKHLKGLRQRLAQAHQQCAARLQRLGFSIFHEPEAGIFLWAQHPAAPDSTELARRAAEQDILLGPGHLFGADLRPSAWLRFNVAFSDDPALDAFLQGLSRSQ